MRNKIINICSMFFAVCLLLFSVLYSIHSPGTGDISIWKRWVNNSDKFGVVEGFKLDKSDYPPYSALILLGSLKVGRLFGLTTFNSIKLGIITFLFLTLLIFWLWTKNFWLTLFLYISIALNTVALGYIDIFFAPTLLLSLWALKRNKIMLSICLYSISFLIKWQPIIIAPFILVYILKVRSLRDLKGINFKRLISTTIFPTLIILGITSLIFSFEPILQSFKGATGHTFLSGFALNFNWVITHLLHVFRPQEFGGLSNGESFYIHTTNPEINLLPKLLFILFYSITLVTFFRRDKNFEGFLKFSLIAYLSYFIFNTGVHENHLFLVIILSFVLFWSNRNNFLLMIVMILMSNLNLFLFYGINGAGINRVINNTLDVAFPFSILNVILFFVFWIATIKQPNLSIKKQIATANKRNTK